jgi:cation diffusion facilitator CzcD-associated flavoprotein CzcO
MAGDEADAVVIGAGMAGLVIEHVRADVHKAGEPKAQALLETTAEVLQGLVTAYRHYEQASEPAWQCSSHRTLGRI